MCKRPRTVGREFLLGAVFVMALNGASAGQQRPLTFVDLMKFEQIEQVKFSDNGGWVAFHAKPDRGDGSVVVRSTESDTRYEVAGGSHPEIAHSGLWAAMRVDVPLEEEERAENGAKPKRGLALLDLSSGATQRFAEVDSFAFSADGNWLVRLGFRPVESPDSASIDSTGERALGGLLVLQEMGTDVEIEIVDVRKFSLDKERAMVAYAVASPDSLRDGLYLRDLNASPGVEVPLDIRPRGDYTELTWSEDAQWLAFLASQKHRDGEPGPAAVYWWNGSSVDEIVPSSSAPGGWMIPAKNTLRWSKDLGRLFFGFRPEPGPGLGDEEDSTGAFDPYDTESILKKRGVDVWHWNDPRINPQQKKVWKSEQERTYAAVYHFAAESTTALADLDVLGVGKPESEVSMLGKAAARYFKEITWDGEYFDLYVIDLRSGAKTKVAERLQASAGLSPDGRFVVYYRSPDWYLYSVEAAATRNVTQTLGVPFSNEDHDYPDDAPDYGIGGWIGEGEAVLIYDKFDVWYVPLSGDEPPHNLTAGVGRKEGRTFRVIRTDPKRDFYDRNEDLLLSSYDNFMKNWGFYRVAVQAGGVRRLLEGEKRFHFVSKAKDVDRYLFTREDYDEFPDLWVSDPEFHHPHKITNLNPQIEAFAWGKSELVEWTSDDGVPLQGVLIRPGNYEAGRRYPVLVYFYRFMSDRLHVFTEPVINHRPFLPLYASNGYAVFLPDIRFEIGRPGFSATKAIVPGVKKLVEMGIADPKAIGLHGHSWGGYQTAFIVTQTDLFAAAVAGAPVSNMTSAYDGIRWESGLARQFQYEKKQSRLGSSLWENRDRYIENSPVFYADRINTPLLFMFGDEDGAVPWYQGIELYLALRRNGKDAVFLQYRGEPHHLKKYPNKLDYAIKMKEYFDHYLKGLPAPNWISEGVPYTGD